MANLTLRNPHSVLAALETRPKDVVRIVLPKTGAHESWERVRTFALKLGVRVETSGGGGHGGHGAGSGERGDNRGRFGAAEAVVKERESLPVETLFESVGSDGNNGLWLALDQVQDPGNVGAIFRAAAFFGVKGIVLLEDRAAALTSTVYDVASGGVEHVPFCVQTNLQIALKKAKDAGLWVLGSSERGNTPLQKVELDRNWILVLGNEEKGMRRLTEEACDVVCTISPIGKVHSLNVSVAAGVLISRLAPTK